MDNATWNRVLTAVAARIGHQDVEIWLRYARPASRSDGTLVLHVPNQYYADWIAENYLGALTAAVVSTLGVTPVIEFECTEDPTSEIVVEDPIDDASDSIPRSEGLNPSQSFRNFVVGNCNRMAHAAAWAVADRPARSYNPLLLYGASGLGKTHLMHAIGTQILERHPGSRVLYVTAEGFTTEMVEAIKTRQMKGFRNRYREACSVLLVDDVQFMSGKEYTQEEFFHTFNALISVGRQIVLTSDVEPAAIDKLEPRLRTRFQGGVAVDLQAPDRETLQAILEQTSAQLGIDISSELADRIAAHISGNIRELQGLLNRLVIAREVYPGRTMDDVARQALPELYSASPTRMSVAVVIEAVARAHDLRTADLTGTRRHRNLTRPRHIAMYLARKYCGVSFPELGREFGKDHSTIQHGVGRVEEMLSSDTDLATRIRVIETTLRRAIRASIA